MKAPRAEKRSVFDLRSISLFVGLHFGGCFPADVSLGDPSMFCTFDLAFIGFSGSAHGGCSGCCWLWRINASGTPHGEDVIHPQESMSSGSHIPADRYHTTTIPIQNTPDSWKHQKQKRRKQKIDKNTTSSQC